MLILSIIYKIIKYNIVRISYMRANDSTIINNFAVFVHCC